MISNNWANAITLGPKSSGILSKALGVAPKNPRVLLQNGVSKYNTPEFFGGSKKEAIKFFQHAIEAFRTVAAADSLSPDWGFEETYAWLGISYTDKNEKDNAREAYNDALKINPEFGWVKYNLLPALDQNNDN
jgi:tetratricopeptide (TPR) repeat protein